jgi:ligand-binding sensor domain-containing protein
MRIFLVLLLSAASHLIIWGQEEVFLFKNLDKQQGLSNNSVKCFLRDSKGFLWIGTNEGLNRYDGYNFRAFKNNPTDTTSLRDNHVTLLFEDHKQHIWVQAGDYLDVFDPATETFNHSQSLFDGRVKIPPVSKSYCVYDNDSNIWYGNSSLGVYKYSPKDGKLMHVNHLPNSNSSLTSDSVTSIAVDSKNNIWVATSASQLERLDNNTGKVTLRVALPWYSDHNYKLFIDKDDWVWITDQNQGTGLYVFDPDANKLTNYREGDKTINLPKDVVSMINQDDAGNIWIGTDHGGILVYNKLSHQQTHLTNQMLHTRSLAGNSIS